MNSHRIKPWGKEDEDEQPHAGANNIVGPRVFVVQNTLHRDSTTKELVPKFDLSPASSFGQLIELLSPSAAPFSSDTIVLELKAKLFDFCDDDYLLLVGNPVLIGMAYALAAQANGGSVRALQWSNGRYIAVTTGGLLLGQGELG